jgi:hypothetical protein
MFTACASNLSSKPIWVARKVKGKKRSNIFLDDRGYPDQSHEFDVILYNIKGSPILCQRKHQAPPNDGIELRFLSHYNKACHSAKLQQELDLLYLNSTVCDKVYHLLQKYWSVFDNKGQFIPVKDYTCLIYTGNAHSICIKKIKYGLRKIPIMRRCISSLAKLGHIHQIHNGGWLFKALLAPKPHQEHVSNIDEFVWCFCINCIPLNWIMRPVAYPIPRCDSAVYLRA